MTRPLGVWVDEVVRWVDRTGARPIGEVVRTMLLNGEPVQTVVPVPVAGPGRDGRFHTGRVVDSRVVARAVELTDAAEVRRVAAMGRNRA